jgi:hypothetical protein
MNTAAVQEILANMLKDKKAWPSATFRSPKQLKINDPLGKLRCKQLKTKDLHTEDIGFSPSYSELYAYS